MTTTRAGNKETGRGVVAGNFTETTGYNRKDDAYDLGTSEARAPDRLIPDSR